MQPSLSEDALKGKELFESRSLRIGFLVFLLAAALAIRLYNANEPPLSFATDRQYFGLLGARTLYLEDSDALTYLEKAVDHGWLYLDYLKNCAPFNRLHGTLKWTRILKKIQRKLNKHRDSSTL